MLYSLTEKMNFEDNPQIEVNNKKITVKADAETVLELVAIMREKGETEATLQAFDLLFSEKDQKTVKGLKLSFKDYMKLLSVAVSLAFGEDPEEDEPGEE